MFNLETALQAWRRTLETNRTFLQDDVDELEYHIRDEVREHMLYGYTEEEAFHKALRELGHYGATETEYQKVYWGKARRQLNVLVSHFRELLMLHNYFKIAYRNFKKHTGFATINVLGLAVGIASSVIILLYAENALTYDTFHANADDTYLVYKERHTAQGVRNLDDTWVPMLPEIQNDYPNVVNGVRLFSRGRWIETNGRKFEESVVYADPSLFEVFSYPLVDGAGAQVMQNPNNVILSQAAATRFFGTENPIGRTITVDYTTEYQVAGILEPVPENATIIPGSATARLDIVLPLQSIIAPDDEEANSNWDGSFLFTYIQLDGTTTEEAFESQLPSLVEKVFGTEGANGTQQLKMRLWPLTDLHNRDFDSNRYATTLILIAFAIILIACINFMNLTTARSMERAREVGMRKVLGAHRKQLVYQFLGESMFTALLALVIGLGVAYLLLPTFNHLYDLSLSLNFADNMWLLGALASIGLLTGLLSGSYPALVLSRFQPVETVKGHMRARPQGVRLRNTLVVVQFALSILLIIGTVVMWVQVNHMKTHDLNFEKNNIVAIPTSLRDFPNAEEAATRMETIKNELLQIGGVETVASSMEVPSRFVNANIFARPEDWQQEDPLRMRITVVDDAYLDLYGMTFIEGRNFDREIASDAQGVILNETAMRDMGWDTAVGKQVNNWTVVGVVKDYNYQSLENDVRAVIHLYRTSDNRNHNYISVKVNSADVPGTVARIESRWQSLDPERTFEFFFIDADFNRLYESVEDNSTLIGYFSILGILIACLGLLALASFTVVQRTKEIGVRKALGASITNILALLSKQFAKPVLLANLIAWPVAYWALGEWLQDFAFRTAMPWWVFPSAGVCVLAIALATVSYHAMKAAKANPVTSLRYE